MAEGGLDQLALGLPEGAFAGEESVAEERADGGVIARFVKVGGVFDQDGFNGVRMRDHDDGRMKEMVQDYIAEFASAFSGIAAPMADQLVSVAQRKYSFGTRRKWK